MFEKMIFDDEPIEIPVSVRRKEYVLCEATEGASIIWRNATMAAAVLGESGKPIGVKNLAETDSLLLSLCMVTAEDRKMVSLATIRGWGSRVVKPLAEKAKEISDLREETVEQLGKRLADAKKREGLDPNARDATTDPSA
jgi:hypothetical protein